MRVEAEAIICGVRVHGEHGAIVRALTRDHGLLAGYVRGGRSRQLRPVLVPGNIVAADFRARTEDQLAGLAVELVHSRAPLLAEPLAAAGIDWATALAAATLPEGLAAPRLFDALGGVLDAIEAAPAARGWAGSLARFELLLLAELGFGLDLERCVATGVDADLAYVSPKSGGAVSRAAGEPHAARLFRLPLFLLDGGPASWDELFDALTITGHFLARDLLTDRKAEVLAARERLLDRLRRAAG